MEKSRPGRLWAPRPQANGEDFMIISDLYTYLYTYIYINILIYIHIGKFILTFNHLYLH